MNVGCLSAARCARVVWAARRLLHLQVGYEGLQVRLSNIALVAARTWLSSGPVGTRVFLRLLGSALIATRIMPARPEPGCGIHFRTHSAQRALLPALATAML